MIRLLLVCLGGALGSGARFLVGITVPHGTLVVNLVGSFLIAMAMESMRATDTRLMIVTGILGGFTTYSAFNEETLRMMRSGNWSVAATYVAATVLGCFVAGALGFAAARMIR